MASLSERAFCEVVRRLRAIRTEDGYDTAAGRNVLFSTTPSERQLPAVVVWDDGEVNATTTAGRAHEIDLTLTVEGAVRAEQDETGEALQRVKADVKRAVLVHEEHMFDAQGKIGTIRYAGATARPRQPGHTIETLAMTFVVHFIEGVGNPASSQPPQR